MKILQSPDQKFVTYQLKLICVSDAPLVECLQLCTVSIRLNKVREKILFAPSYVRFSYLKAGVGSIEAFIHLGLNLKLLSTSGLEQKLDYAFGAEESAWRTNPV